MIKDSWLSNVIFTTVQTHVDLSSVRLTGVNGDFNTTDLAAVINTDQTNEVTVRSWLDRAGISP